MGTEGLAEEGGGGGTRPPSLEPACGQVLRAAGEGAGAERARV